MNDDLYDELLELSAPQRLARFQSDPKTLLMVLEKWNAHADEIEGKKCLKASDAALYEAMECQELSLWLDQVGTAHNLFSGNPFYQAALLWVDAVTPTIAREFTGKRPSIQKVRLAFNGLNQFFGEVEKLALAVNKPLGGGEPKQAGLATRPLVDGIKPGMSWMEISFKLGKVQDSVCINPSGGRAKNYTPGELCMLDKKTGTPSTYWKLFMQFVERGELPQSDMTTPSKISRLNTTLKKAFGLNTNAIVFDKQAGAYRLQRRE